MSKADKKLPPPVKVLSSQLRTAERREASDSDSGSSYLLRPGTARSLPASVVWMQGTVLEVQLDRDTALLMDETGTFTVQGIQGVPRGKPCLSRGELVMVRLKNGTFTSVLGQNSTPSDPVHLEVELQLRS